MSFTCLWTAIWHANLQNIASRYVSMQSTIQQTGRYPSKTVNAASSCDSQVTSPDVLSNVWSACRQMETQRSADVWNSCNVEISQASAEKITIAPPVSANRPNTMKERCSVRRKISCLLIHHLAAELKQDVIFLTFPVMNQATSRGFYLLCFPPQAVLHAEEEGAGDVGDRQPLWPPDRMELGCPHPEGQTPQEPAVWVNSKTEDHHDIWLSQRRSIRYYHRWTTNRDLVEGKDFNLT